MDGDDCQVIVLFIFVLDLQLWDVPLIEYFILDGLLQPARAFLHLYALLEQIVRSFEVSLDKLSKGGLPR